MGIHQKLFPNSKINYSSLSFLIFIGINFYTTINITNAQQVESCENVYDHTELYRDYILTGNVETLANYINFPIEGLIGGNKRSLEEVVLKAVWKTIATPEFLGLVKNADTCSLANELKIDENNKINSLVLFYEAANAIYSYSGVSSLKQLQKFIDNAIIAAESEDYDQLAKMIIYPFTVSVNDRNVTIESESQFKLHGKYIDKNKLLELLKKAKEGSFVQHPDNSGTVYLITHKITAV